MSNEQTSHDQMSYERIIDSLNPQMRGGDNDRVGMLKRVLAKLHHPDQQFRIIHVAGTNGKGSTGTMIAQCLHQAGQKVGHFSSPAMVDQREQIQIDGCLIEKSAFATTYEKIVQQLPDDLNADDLTVFEWWTLIMLQYFADQKVDWAVIECGLGGQNDATNAIEAPKLAVITHIALDHTRILGPTIKDIAQAKAGIIKPGTGVVILAPNQDQAARAQIIKRAQACQVSVLDSEKTIQLTVLDQSWAGTQLQLKLPGAELECQFNMLGTFQLDNLKTALTAVDWLNQTELEITPERIAAVLANIVIPGRLQKIGTQPLSFLDGAHNPDAAVRLIQTLDQLGHPQKLGAGLFKRQKRCANGTSISKTECPNHFGNARSAQASNGCQRLAAVSAECPGDCRCLDCLSKSSCVGRRGRDGAGNGIVLSDQRNRGENLR